MAAAFEVEPKVWQEWEVFAIGFVGQTIARLFPAGVAPLAETLLFLQSPAVIKFILFHFTKSRVHA